MLDSEISKIADAYTTVLKPKRLRKAIDNPVIVGLDSEYDGHGLISLQFSIKKSDGLIHTRIFYLNQPSLSSQEFTGLLKQFIRESNVPVPRTVYVVSHFSQSELKHLADLWSNVKVRVVNRSMFGELKHDDLTVKFIDLFAYYPTSLEVIGQLTGKQKMSLEGLDGLSGEYWKANMRLLHEKHPDIFEEYASRDSEIVTEAFNQLRSLILNEWGIDVLHTVSLAHLSAQIFTGAFLTKPVEPVKYEWTPFQTRKSSGEWTTRWRKTWVYSGSRDKRYFAMKAYWGGRREAFIQGLIKEPVEVWDVKSMYPTMSKLPLPVQTTRWSFIQGIENLDSILDGVGYAHCTFRFPEDTYAPSLPVYDSRLPKLIYPLEGESWCTTYELNLAVRLGAQINSLEAWVFYPTDEEKNHPLKAFMEHFYALKSKAKEGSLEYETVKLIMNSLIGKLAQRDGELTVEGYQGLLEALNYNWDEFSQALRSLELKSKIRSPVYTGELWAPEWASLITGASRAVISEIMNTSQALTGHTDSAIILKGSKIKCEATSLLEALGSKLEFKLEGDSAWIGRSALYSIIQNDRIVKVAHHGIPTDTHEDFARILQANLQAQAPIINQAQKTHLTTPKEALRKRIPLGAQTIKTYKINWAWDYKRALINPDINIWSTWTPTRAWLNLNEALKTLEAQKPRSQKWKPQAEKTKLTPEILNQAIKMIENGESIRQTAKQLGVSHPALIKALRKQSIRLCTEMFMVTGNFHLCSYE